MNSSPKNSLQSSRSNSRRETITALIFVSPWVIGFGVFLLYPLLASIYYSFCDYSVLRPPVYIGADNYVGLWHDEIFWQALKNTAIYSFFALPIGAAVALALAMLLNTKVKGMTFYRTLFYIPSLVPAVALGVLITWIFNGEHGILNEIIGRFSLPHITWMGMHLPQITWVGIKGPNWLGDPNWSKTALIIMSAWGAGNAMVIYLAGLQDVPQALYEAADLDGAGWWAKTWNVTLPMLSPVILFNVIMGIIGTLQIFTVPYIVSPTGSPARSLYFYVTYLFDNAFIFHKMGYACAMGWIMFLIVLMVTGVALRLSNRHVYYGGS